MSEKIKIRVFEGAIQYGDLEDIPDGAATELVNMRPVRGKLVKSLEMGNKLYAPFGTTSRAVTNFFTWVNSRLTQSGTGYAYVIPFLDNSTKLLNIALWYSAGGFWRLFGDEFAGVSLSAYYQTLGTDDVSRRLPVIQDNETLRFLPGYTAKPDGTNVAVGCWIGWIGYDLFDSLHPASAYTAKFFSYPREIAKPALTLTFTQQNGDGVFSASEDIPISDGSAEQQFVTIAGSYPGVFGVGKTFTIHGNPQNFGVFGIDTSEVYSTTTKLWLDGTQAYVDRIGGFVRATTERESRWYKFSYVYDGNQESLLSEPHKIDFADQKFLQCTFSITKTAHNMRITAVKVYRSASGNAGTYYHIHTIDFLRKSGKFKSGSSGCYAGERTIYIPGLSNTATGRNPTGAGEIKLWNNNTQNWTTKTTASYLTDTGRAIFEVTADITEDDFWDCAWEYYAYGTGQAVTATGGSGAFAGRKALIIGESLGSYSYSGGVVNFPINNVATYRSTDSAYLKALHLTAEVIDATHGLSNGAWKLCCTEDGLWFTTDGTSVTFDFFDTDLPDGALHPLEAEVSINVNGAYALMVGNRLFQAKICLDPSDKAEQHPDWISWSEFDQPDVTPMKNVKRIHDNSDSGALTGIKKLFDMPVFLLERGFVALNIKSSPLTPALWGKMESAHNIGNLAPLGAVNAGDSLYVCSMEGFYRIRVNNLAASDSTPTEKMKISEDIENIYNAMTTAQKQAIVGEYHHRRNEIHWYFTYTDPDTSKDVYQHWAYNVITGAWRETDVVFDMQYFALDEVGNAMALEQPVDGYSRVVDMEIAADPEEEGDRFLWRSKMFAVSDDDPKPIHRITVIYKSPHALKLRLYLDGNDTMTEEYDLPAQARTHPYTVAVGYSCYRMQFVITDDTDEALVIEESSAGPVYLIVEQSALSPNVEIGGVNIVIG
jgi:hypothetical protein